MGTDMANGPGPGHWATALWTRNKNGFLKCASKQQKGWFSEAIIPSFPASLIFSKALFRFFSIFWLQFILTKVAVEYYRMGKKKREIFTKSANFYRESSKIVH
jgi:hypothetical protein